MSELLKACGFNCEVVFSNDHRVCFKAFPLNVLNPKILPRRKSFMPGPHRDKK